MFSKGEYVVYKKEVCMIKDIKNLKYILSPVDDRSLTITVPIDTKMRKIISKDESIKLINSIPNIDTININDKLIENEYKKLINSGNLEDLIKVIKTTYLRNEKRVSNHKKIGEKDDNYFKKSEKLLYSELCLSLNIPYEDVKNYIKKIVEQM